MRQSHERCSRRRSNRPNDPETTSPDLGIHPRYSASSNHPSISRKVTTTPQRFVTARVMHVHKRSTTQHGDHACNRPRRRNFARRACSWRGSFRNPDAQGAPVLAPGYLFGQIVTTHSSPVSSPARLQCNSVRLKKNTSDPFPQGRIFRSNDTESFNLTSAWKAFVRPRTCFGCTTT